MAPRRSQKTTLSQMCDAQWASELGHLRTLALQKMSGRLLPNSDDHGPSRRRGGLVQGSFNRALL
jgi:hypothetical protein